MSVLSNVLTSSTQVAIIYKRPTVCIKEYIKNTELQCKSKDAKCIKTNKIKPHQPNERVDKIYDITNFE